MRITGLRVKNFRALDDIEVAFDKAVSVIIGPNAIGKTTVLEAIRLAKAVLGPRTSNEANQAFFYLGAMSPHAPQRLFPNSMTTRPDEATIIKTSYLIDDSELAKVRETARQLPAQLALANAGIQFSNQNQIASYFSSAMGLAALESARKEIDNGITELSATKRLRLNLTLDWVSGQVSGEFPIEQAFFRALETSLNPSQTNFSYFPADRSMPFGEQPVQLGVADIAAQLESYNSQPQSKFVRLKHTIFSSIVQSESGRQTINDDFELIFRKILKGRRLSSIGISDIGTLSILIEDIETGKTFDIDALSSGEKGLILTFLLIARSMVDGGIVLIDEPELHLNPAVSRDLLQFFIEEFAAKRNMQALMCSHSAEILNGTLEDTSCQLYHLRDGRSLASVRQHDQGEIRDALRRLGTSEGESWLYNGTVSVEGIHDAEIFQSGFEQLFRRYKFRERGGRQEIETSIRQLQTAERRADEIGFHFFVFDHDRQPTGLSSSGRVRLMQLERYCLENYLIDIEILTDLSRETEFSERGYSNTTDLRNALKELALGQVKEVAARKAFRSFGLEQIGFQIGVLRDGGTAAVMAQDLLQQMGSMQNAFSILTSAHFDDQFVRKFGEELSTLEPIWEEKWREVCDGKRLFEQARAAGMFKGDLLRLKKRIAVEMGRRKTDDWRSLESRLKELLKRD